MKIILFEIDIFINEVIDLLLCKIIVFLFIAELNFEKRATCVSFDI